MALHSNAASGRTSGTHKRGKQKKLPFGVTEEFVSEVDSASPEDLKSRLVQIQSQIDDSQVFLKTDERVLDLKQEYDMVAGPVRDAIKSLRNRNKLVLEALKKSGS